MSMFGDYKAYKNYEPYYSDWKKNRDIADAKRLKYIELHPEVKNPKDIQKGKNLLRAIDIMDEYSQKKAENMEAATEPIITIGLELAGFAGGALGFALGKIKPIGKFFGKFASKGSKYTNIIKLGIPTGIGIILGSFTAFPLMAWGAKAEVGASRKGRFEAMRKELDNPNGFAILTPDQIKEAKIKSQNIILDEDKNKKTTEKIAKSFNALKDMTIDSKEYKIQKAEFEKALAVDEKNINKKVSPQEIENAKKDQQILTKLIEKIDIASQDYAENSELAVQAGILTVGGFSALIYFGLEKLLNKLNIKSANKIAKIGKVAGFASLAGMGILGAQINKEASRVGRFKVKQELAKNPNNFIYVSDEKLNEIKDADVKKQKKQNVFSFLISAFKDNREYKKYKKTEGKNERRFYKAVEKLKLSDQQIKDAKRLQKNTFRTFNKVDENSQKYAESVEALGQAISYPISEVLALASLIFAVPYLMKAIKEPKNRNTNFAKYFGIVMLSTIPSLFITNYITKEQKKASRIADMKSIDELKDYRKFV